MTYFLLFLGLISGLIAIFRHYIPKAMNYWVTVLLCGILVLSVGGQAYLVWSNKKQEWQSKWSGKLESRIKSFEAKEPVLILGETLRFAPKVQPVFIFENGFRDEISLRLVDGEAQISINIRDEKGNQIGFIRDNVWTVAQGIGADRNFNQDTLEIIDAQGRVVFQVHVEGEKVYFAMAYQPKGIIFVPWLHELQGREGSLFKYPSSEYSGELNPITNSVFKLSIKDIEILKLEFPHVPTAIVIKASITNTGASGIAKDYSLTITTPNNNKFQPTPIIVPADFILFFSTKDKGYTLSARELLYHKTIQKAVGTGETVQGILIFELKGIKKDSIIKEGTIYTLKCKDIKEKEFTIYSDLRILNQ